MIQESTKNEHEVYSNLSNSIKYAHDYTINTLNLTFELLTDLFNSKERLSERLKVKQFSDNIYFSFDYEIDEPYDLYFGIYIIITISSIYQRIMMNKGYFVRGGIAHGLNLVDDHLIFSEALIKAVEIEKKATYPRITLHKETVALFTDTINNPFREITSDLLIEDWAKHVFLNPFFNVEEQVKRQNRQITDSDFKKLMKKIAKNIIDLKAEEHSNLFNDTTFRATAHEYIKDNLRNNKLKNQEILEKYIWLENLLNWVEKKRSNIKFSYK
jgi:hypothetical protein